MCVTRTHHQQPIHTHPYPPPKNKQAKGVIRDIVTWPRARSYFFWRAKRRIAEDQLVRQMQAASASTVSVKEARVKLAGLAGEGVYTDDQAFVRWVEERYECVGWDERGTRLCVRVCPYLFSTHALSLNTTLDSGAAIAKELSSVKQAAVKQSMASLLEGLSPEERKQVLSGL